MSKAIVLQHVEAEGPGRIMPVFRDFGIPLEVRRLYRGDEVPTDLDELRCLVVLGGPMGVGDVDDPRHAYLAREITLLREALARDRPALGICLGAQLLAAAAGARVYPNTRRAADGAVVPAREVGWGFVDFAVARAGHEPVLAGLPPRQMVLHWHGDTFDLPRGAMPLASTPACRNQAFRLGWKHFALQFHCELSADDVAVWVRQDAAYVREANGDGGGARILADTESHLADARPAWDRLLRNILDQMIDEPRS